MSSSHQCPFDAENPLRWSAKTLERLGGDALHRLALQAVGALTVLRLLLGRCLLAVGRTDLFVEHGCSGPIHYAVKALGVKPRTAWDARRVALRLEELPLLAEAAEKGVIPWSMLREIARKATLETEAYWLQMMGRVSYHALERLLRRTPYGGIPGDPGPDGATIEPDQTELQAVLPREAMAMFQRILRGLSHKAGRAVRVAEALEWTFGQILAGCDLPDEDEMERAREEARKGRRRRAAAARPGSPGSSGAGPGDGVAAGRSGGRPARG